MQEAHSTRKPVAFPFDPALVEPLRPLVPVAVVAVLVVAMLATAGAFEPPPQPASATAAAARTASPPNLREAMVVSRPSGIREQRREWQVTPL
jgi:hypothetical protein